MIRAHQPGAVPIDIPEAIPNPVIVPEPNPAPKEPAPREPVKVPEKVPTDGARRQAPSPVDTEPPLSRDILARHVDLEGNSNSAPPGCALGVPNSYCL